MNETTQMNCELFDGETLMSYMYGELDGAATVHVEDHLLECANCRTEFADLSLGHLSVFEWNKLEFEPLATPAINIEYARKRGVFAALSEAFAGAGKWRLAVPAFAAFVLALSGIFMYSRILSDTTELAKDQLTVTASPAENLLPPKQIELPPDSSEAAEVAEVAESQPVPERDGSSEKTRAITVSEHRAPKRIVTKRAIQPVRNESIPSAMTVADGPVRLSDFEELEDESPRLSELFDESEAS